ncbi:MAG TPA: serine/threonine-protein kinase [Gemmatimonadales bacterium]|nr:serine/threonine-protein kinase [Gemmatimonadales bacterium]
MPAAESRVRNSAKDAPHSTAQESARYGSLTGTVLDGRYRIGDKVGEGGMSWVYQAEELGTGKTVAIKLLPPRLAKDSAAVERLRREADIADRFEHPNVCPILAFGHTDENVIYLVMPFLTGETLSDYEIRTRAVSLREGVQILVQVCRGLQHAHDLGIIHRDLKPENVMLVEEGQRSTVDGRPLTVDRRPSPRAVVMDFGLAKRRRASAEVVKLTQTGIVLGTPEFMSPEQIRGRPLDGRSDIYAVGVLAFELFTGQLPFVGKDAQETMMARLKGLPRRLREFRPDLPSRLDTVVARALELAPEDRYQTMSDFANALERVVSGGRIARLFRRRN